MLTYRQYLELTTAYSTKEADRNPLRGAGLYEARKTIDTQDSWNSFSHRYAISTFNLLLSLGK